LSTYSDHAIILKRIDFDEAKRIITLFTRNHGKVSAIAPGVRKVTSRKGSHLELFNHSQVFLAKGKNLDIITEAETIDFFENIRNDLEKIGQAYYIVELIDSLLPEQQRNDKVFDLTLAILKKLNKVDTRQPDNQNYSEDSQPLAETRQLLRDFEVNLLKLLGYWSNEIHSKNYPKNPTAQARFNQLLIQQITEKELHTPKFLEKLFWFERESFCT